MDAKEILAKNALEHLKQGDVIGIGTGRTTKRVIEEISKNKSIFSSKLYIASSIDSEITLSNYGFNVISLFSGKIPDIYVDSFDNLVKLKDNSFVLIKGGGGALLREKLLSSSSKYRLFLGESNKFLDKSTIATIKVPIEIVPVSINYVIKNLKEKLNLESEIRLSNGKMGPIFSDNGNILLDIIINAKNNENLCQLDLAIAQIPGVIETGIFCNNLYDTILLADENGKLEIIKKG